MDALTFFLSPGGSGGSYFPGLIMPASVLLVVVLSAATYIYLAGIGGGADGSSGRSVRQD